MPTTLTLIASFQARPGYEDRLRDELNAMIEPSTAEEGCLGYRPLADPNRPGAMVCLEEWADEAALQYHFTTPHFKRINDALQTILAEPFGLRRLTDASDGAGN
jgi:quinol monooxygenase YgiN